jgi:hypothetical protein
VLCILTETIDVLLQGTGVFLAFGHTLAPGEVVSVYFGELFYKKHMRRHAGSAYRMQLALPNNAVRSNKTRNIICVDARDPRTTRICAMFNHSKTPNVKFVMHTCNGVAVPCAETICTINGGEELVVDYGDDYFADE